MELLKTIYILQDINTKMFIGVDSKSGGYPYLTDNPDSANQFYSEEKINEFLNGGKFNLAYKESFPEECGNTIMRKLLTYLD